MSIESEADILFKQWQAQQKMLTKQSGFSNNMNDSMGTDQSPHLTEHRNIPTTPDQSPINPVNSVRPMGPPMSQTRNIQQPKQQTFSAPNGCPQCGMLHPPIAQGQKCPNASIITEDEKKAGVSETFIKNKLVDLRNIILAQMSSKQIKDGKKFFQYAIVELTQALEKYNE
jgi:hypothetical protein